MPTAYKIIRTFNEVKQLADYCIQAGWCSLDFETNAKPASDPDGKPTIVGICFQPGFSYIIPLGHFDSPFGKKYKKIFRYFGKRVLSNPKVIKVAWNLKFEQTWCIKYGIQLLGILMDGMLAKHLLDENTKNDLKSCVKSTIPEFADYEDEIDTLVKKHKGWDKVPLEPLSLYCAKDCDLTLRLMWHYEKSLMRNKLYNLFRNSCMMSTRVLAESEFHGMPVDKLYLETLIEKYQGLVDESERQMMSLKPVRRFNRALKRKQVNKLIDKIQDEISLLEDSEKANRDKLIAARRIKINRYYAGTFTGKEIPKEINFASPVQMLEFMYNSKKGLRLPKQFRKDKKTKEMKLTTDEKSLLAVKDKDKTGFIKHLLDHRGLSKLNDTYVKGMMESLGVDNRIHCKFHIHGTVTGRFSSSNPNMQNIPRVTTNADIKKMFIPPPGYLLMEVDYAQAELRIVSELANEIEMIQWFNNKVSVHVAVACKAEGADYDVVYPITKDKKHPDYLYWAKRKKRAKTINFGILYGQTEMKLAETLNSELEPGEDPVSVEEARQFMLEWFELFPRIKRWIKKQHNRVKEEGHVYNMFGRKRRLYDSIDSGVKWIIEEACRQAVNTPVQGTSADFTNLAAIVIREHKQRGDLPLDMVQAYTVHDSIGYYIKPEHIHEVAPKIIKLCEDPDTMDYFGFKLKKVKMKVEPEIGTTWANIEEYDPKVDYTKLLNSNE